MSGEDYVSSFVRNTLGLAIGYDLVLQTSEIHTIVEHLSGYKSPEQAFDAPVNSILNAINSKILDERLGSGKPFVRKALWPEGVNFAVALTHDADRLTAPLSHVRKVRKRFPLSLIIKRILSLDDPYWNIEKMVNLEAELNFTSSFYLLVHDYSLDRRRDYIKSIGAKGWEIGLHGSFGTHDNAEMMREDFNTFEKETGQKPRGIREHYLEFDPSKTWQIMDELGFMYDTTWGFNKKPGFRAGLCFPYHPPSPNFEPLNILELPLTLMDTSLWGYMHLQEEDGFAEVERTISKVKEHRGLFTLLWHQEALQMKGGRLYPRILRRLAGESCFVSNAERMAEWWLNRERSEIQESKRGRSFSYTVQSKDKRMVIDADYPKGYKIKVQGECRVISSSENSARIAANGGGKIIIEAP
ncbi:MAG: hypothetical protein FJ358_03205 [Thaumarchaeota archaeon]|nr:hypothetical protein [Nitrososphaerota archaeon]